VRQGPNLESFRIARHLPGPYFSSREEGSLFLFLVPNNSTRLLQVQVHLANFRLLSLRNEAPQRDAAENNVNPQQRNAATACKRRKEHARRETAKVTCKVSSELDASWCLFIHTCTLFFGDSPRTLTTGWRFHSSWRAPNYLEIAFGEGCGFP